MANWGWDNLLIGLIGVGIIVFNVFMFRRREAALKYFAREQQRLFGTWAANKIHRRATPMSGVGVPAIGGIVIGAVFVLGAIFGNPQTV